MKTRNGFVSNSSSSSFVLMVKKEVHEKVMEQLGPYEKAVIKELISENTVFGTEVFYFGDLVVQNCSYTFDDFYIEWDGKYQKENIKT